MVLCCDFRTICISQLDEEIGLDLGYLLDDIGSIWNAIIKMFSKVIIQGSRNYLLHSLGIN